MESKALEEIEGTGARASFPLTYMGANAIPADVLADGRILFEAGFPLGEGATPEMYLVYSDGSGVESYRCDHRGAGARWGGKQLQSGDVVFTHGASLARFTSPLAHEERVAAPRGELCRCDCGDRFGRVAGECARFSECEICTEALETRRSGDAGSAEPPWRKPGRAGIVAAHERPKRHPSALHPWDYANLLALDARLSRDGALKGAPASVRLETQDADGHAVAMGTAPVEADGSFFVKAPADRPIRFVLLDAKGAVLRQEHGWFWIRRGEQRICVGCHTGPERAAENRVPEVLLRTTTPVDLTGSAQTLQRGGN